MATLADRHDRPATRCPPLRVVWRLAREAAGSWKDDYAPSMGAALAYYTIFSLAPALLITISVAGLAFGADAARGEIYEQLNSLIGEAAARAVQGLLESASKPSESIAGATVGLVLLVVAATTVFGELQDSLDRIWRAPSRSWMHGLLGLLRTRLLSFVLILGIGVLLATLLAAGAALAAMGRWWAPRLQGWAMISHATSLAFVFALVALASALVYRYIPRVPVQWKDVWLGAVVSALLFALGRWLIGLYIGQAALSSVFGAAGSLIVVMVWVYYSAQIFLLGAEFTRVYAHRFGSRRGHAYADPAP